MNRKLLSPWFCRMLILMMLLIAMVFSSGCSSGGGSDDSSADTYQEPAALTAPVTKQQAVDVELPTSSSLNNETLKVISFYGESQVLTKAKKLYKTFPVTITDTTKGQIVILADSSDNPLFFSYIEATTGTATINSEGIAKALLWTNPYVLGLKPDQRKVFMNKISQSTLFPQLVVKIENCLVTDPKKLFDDSEIIKTSFAVVKEIYEINTTAKVFKDIGEDSNPHITDESGTDVGFENPKGVAYGVKVAGTTTEYILVEGKENFFSFGIWPPRLGTTPSVKKSLFLLDGQYAVNFYKGFNWNEEPSNWWKPLIPVSPVQPFSDATISGTATWVNFFYAVDSVIDGFTGMSIREYIMSNILGRFVSKIDAKKAAKLIEIFKSGDAVAVGEETIKFLATYWDDCVYAIWQSLPFDTNGYVTKINSLLGKTIPYLKAVTWANSYGPLYWDWIFAKGKYSYCIQQSGGVLNECSGVNSIIPPTASLTVSPIYPYIGDTVAFDASGSTDDTTTTLKYRFDYDGDGTWDTALSTNSTATYSYSSTGTYNAKVEVTDGDGQTAISSYYVTVYDRSQGISNAMVIDRSGSMDEETKMSDAINAAKTYVNYMGTADRGAVIDFDDVVTITQPYTYDKNLLITAIDSLSPRGMTAFFDAVYTAITETAKEDVSRRKAIIALTDGLDNSSVYKKDIDVSVKKLADITDYAKQQGIPIYTIGLGTDVESATLQDIASQTNALYFYAPDSSQLQNIYDTIRGIK